MLTLYICIIKWELNFWTYSVHIFPSIIYHTLGGVRKTDISSIYLRYWTHPSAHIHSGCAIKILRQLRYPIWNKHTDQLSFSSKWKCKWNGLCSIVYTLCTQTHAIPCVPVYNTTIHICHTFAQCRTSLPIACFLFRKSIRRILNYQRAVCAYVFAVVCMCACSPVRSCACACMFVLNIRTWH